MGNLVGIWIMNIKITEDTTFKSEKIKSLFDLFNRKTQKDSLRLKLNRCVREVILILFGAVQEFLTGDNLFKKAQSHCNYQLRYGIFL